MVNAASTLYTVHIYTNIVQRKGTIWDLLFVVCCMHGVVQSAFEFVPIHYTSILTTIILIL